MTVFLSDSFTVSSATFLTSHLPETGGAWKAGTTPYQMSVSANAPGYATGSSASGTAEIWHINLAAPPSADYDVKGRFKASAGDKIQGLVARSASNGYSLYYCYWNPAAGVYVLAKRVSGALSDLASAVPPKPLSKGDHEVTLRVNGTTLSVIVNGSPIINVSDATFTAAGHAGILGEAGAKIDSVSAEDISGGVLSIATGFPQAHEIIQRSPPLTGTTATRRLTGTYLNLAPKSVSYTLLRGGDAVPGHEDVVLDASPAAGTWEGTATLPVGGPYVLQVSAAGKSKTSEPFLVGANIGAAGQSNMRVLSDSGAAYGYSLLPVEAEIDAAGRGFYGSRGTWARTASAGERALVNELSARLSVPVGLINMAVGSTAILAANDDSGGHWQVDGDNGPHAAYSAAKNAFAEYGIEALIFQSGENDAAAGNDLERIPASLSALFKRFRSDLALPELKVVVGNLGPFSSGNEAALAEVRSGVAAHIAADARSFARASEMDLTLGDVVHYDRAACEKLGFRIARSLAANLYDRPVQWRGPAITEGLVVSETELHLFLEHGGSDEIAAAPPGGYGGFEISEDGSIWMAAAGARLGPAAIRLSHPESRIAAVRYLFGNQQGERSVRDGAGFPLEPAPQSPPIVSVDTVPPQARRGRITVPSPEYGRRPSAGA